MNANINVDSSGDPVEVMDVSDDPKFPEYDLPFDLNPLDLMDDAMDGPKSADIDYSNSDLLWFGENISQPTEGAKFLNKGVLYPPHNPQSNIPKLPGWKTVSVCGLPKSTTIDIVMDIFEKCGEILAIHKDNDYYHIKFSSEIAVADALKLTGYRLKIENQTDTSNNGQMFIHYGEARDYKSEYRQHPSFTKAQQRNIKHYKIETEELKTACNQELKDLTEGNVFSKIQESQTMTDQFGSEIDLMEEFSRLRAKIDSLSYQLSECQKNFTSLKISSHQMKKLFKLKLGVLQFGIKKTLKGTTTGYAIEEGYSEGTELSKETKECSCTFQRHFSESDVRHVCIIWRYLAVDFLFRSSNIISSYLKTRLNIAIQPLDVDDLLKEFPTMFKKECDAAGNIVKWGAHII